MRNLLARMLLLSVAAITFCQEGCRPAAESKPDALELVLDQRSPYLILATPRAGKSYRDAVLLARELHPQARYRELDIGDGDKVRRMLGRERPYYALLFAEPQEIDAALAWNWFKWSSAVDDDPFLDVRFGFITGENPRAALGFVSRIRDALRGELFLPRAAIDNLGPNYQMGPEEFARNAGSFMLPAFAQCLPIQTISHGPRGFGIDRLPEMAGAGLVHFGGHGYPDRIVDCLNGPFVRRVPFAPSLIFSGACFSGVTGGWFDPDRGGCRAAPVPVSLSFALGILANRAVAFCAPLHAGHGLPVYQEMEFLLSSGDSLGNVLKHTMDGVATASPRGRETPAGRGNCLELPDGPSRVMLWGSSSRVLFGDPALRLANALCKPPLQAETSFRSPSVLLIEAGVSNHLLRTSFFDTYYSDLSQQGPFNGRIYLKMPLPDDTTRIKSVSEVMISAVEKIERWRLVGLLLEKEGVTRTLHLQIDVPSSAYLESPFRSPSGKLSLLVEIERAR